jgi:hypothetical protein
MASEIKPPMTWREAIAAENARIGVKSTPNAPILRVHDDPPQVKLGSDLGGRLRHVTGEPNGLEKRYMAHLELRRMCGEILSWKFEVIKLKLAKATFYNVDFHVVMPDRTIELHETKAHAEDDWRVKHKVAVEMFPEYTFVIVKWNKNTEGWEFK